MSVDGLECAYAVRGQIFFASVESFLAGFDFDDRPARIVIDVSHAHFWDISAVGALDKAVLKMRRDGAEVTVIGLNEASATMIDRFALHDKDGKETPVSVQ